MVALTPELKIARKQQTARESVFQRLESNLGTLYVLISQSELVLYYSCLATGLQIFPPFPGFLTPTPEAFVLHGSQILDCLVSSQLLGPRSSQASQPLKAYRRSITCSSP